jgi:hypothetical protein
MILAEYRWEGPVLNAGKHTLVFDFTYHGPGVGKDGTGVLTVDGVTAVTLTVPRTIAFLEVADEPFDIGSDTRTGVCDKDYQVPFTFNGKINQVTFKVGPLQFGENDRINMLKARAVAYD